MEKLRIGNINQCTEFMIWHDKQAFGTSSEIKSCAKKPIMQIGNSAYQVFITHFHL